MRPFALESWQQFDCKLSIVLEIVPSGQIGYFGQTWKFGIYSFYRLIFIVQDAHSKNQLVTNLFHPIVYRQANVPGLL